MSIEELREQLQALQHSHDELLTRFSASNGLFHASTSSPETHRASARDHRHSDAASPGFGPDASTLSSDSEDEDESFFVQEELPSQSFDHEHLREHLKKHSWDEHGREILSAIFTDRGSLKEPHLFPTSPGPASDRSHYSHFQVYDVGPDGVAELVESSGKENTMSKANEIWHSIKDIGVDSAKSPRPVGRITIAREPSPILFGALHLTMNKTFDMNEIFKELVQPEACSAHMHRAFHEDPRHQKTFFFDFEYYTVIGEDCKPMQWQRADKDKGASDSHIPLTRCGAVVALALYDDKPRRIRNKGRRAKTQHGWVQDVWSPWQVLNLQCYPDWRATPDTFESGHRYLNGAEAFLHALLTEYKDARKRYEEIYKRITHLITPPLGFIFDAELRDQRLFEDKEFTWIRRYFYAHQTLGNVNDSIKSMIDSFEDTFTDEVWEGKSKTLWPLTEESPRNDHWKRRLRLLRLQFEHEMKELRILSRENQERRHEIETLQNHLFSGTSIQESRKSVELADITVQQGRNIKASHPIPHLPTRVSNHCLLATYHRQPILHAPDLRNLRLRNDKHAHRPRILDVRHHPRHSLRPLLLPRRLPIHRPRLPPLDGQNESPLALDATQTQRQERRHVPAGPHKSHPVDRRGHAETSGACPGRREDAHAC
jgi:cell division septum initiation protein DivIVA